MAARLNLQLEPILPDLGSYLAAATPVDSGALRDSWSVVQIDEDTLLATNTQPYAAIQQFGGTIPALVHDPSNPRLMVANLGGGGPVFFMSRGPIKIKAQHYVEKALEAWVKDIRWRWK